MHFGSLTFVPICWMCEKQTSVSRGSTEAEIISLDAGLRMDGIPSFAFLQFGYGSVSLQPDTQPCKTKESSAQGKPVASRHVEHTKEESNQELQPSTIVLICFIFTNVPFERHICLESIAMLYVFEGNESVI